MPKIVDKEQMRLDICLQAYNKCIEEGYENFSLNQFILSMNMSKGQFYHYFKSKEELIFAAIETRSYEILELIKTNVSSKNSFLEKLLEFFSYYIDDENQVYVDDRKIMFETMHLYFNPKYKEVTSCENIYSNINEILVDIFNNAIEKNEITCNKEKQIKILLATIEGMYMHSLMTNNYDLKNTVIEYLTDFVEYLKKK